MDKSSEGGEPDTHQLSQVKPQRYSKRLVNLMSGACSVTHAQSSTASAGSTVVHEDDIVTHHHHKLRSHKRLSSSSSSSKNTNSNSRKSTGLRNPSTDCESSIQASNDHHHQPENQGVGDEECCELEIINEERKGKADGRDCCGGEQAAGGSDSSLLKSIISSSSCLPPTNETNELSQQAGLGGPTKRCKRTTATTTTASSCSNNNSPLVTVSPSQKDDDDEHHHDVVDDDDETAAAAHVGCASRASTQLSNDNGCIVETRSESQSDNEMYQEDDDEVGPSCELPRKPSTSLSTTLIQSSPSSQLSVGLNLLNSTGTSYKDDGSEKEKESGVRNNNGDHATFHEKNSSPPNYYHVAGLKIGSGGVSVRENTQKKGCDGEPIVKVKHCDEAQEQKRTDAGDGVERRKNTSIAQDEQEDLDVTKAKLQPPMSIIRSVVMPELQIDGGYDDKPLSAAAASLSNSKQQHLQSPSGVHSNSKKSSRAKKGSQSHQTNSKQSNRRGVGGLGSVHDTIPISSSSPSCSSVVLRSKVQVENNNNNNNYNTRGGASGFSDNSSNSKQSVVEPKKPNIAPMLLMNNLPYMGELTFDTRPRRGRKPKKADICHLISKNYGIQFPVSYINLPNTGTGAQNLPHPVPQPLPPSSSSSTSKSSSHHHKRNHASSTSIPSSSVPILSTSVSASPSSSQMLPPPAFSNRDVSIVPIPSNWRGGSLDKPCSPQVSSPSTCSSGSSGGGMKPLSLAQQLMLHPASAQQAISMFPLPSLPHNQSCHQGKMMSVVQVKEELNDEDGEEEQGGGGGEQGRPENLKMETSSSWDSDDTPLNLCLRDSSSMHDTEPLSLCKGNEVVDDDEYDEQDGGELNSLDVRWNKSVLLHGANATTRNSSCKKFPSAAAGGGSHGGSYGKRNIGGEGGKGCKSAKLSLRTNSSNNSFSGSGNNNNNGGDDVSSLVNQQRLLGCPTSSYSLSVQQQQQLHTFAMEQSAKSSTLRNSSAAAATVTSSSPIFSITQHLKSPLETGSNSGGPGKLSLGGHNSVAGITGGKPAKQGSSGSRKSKRDTSSSNLRGDVSISVSSLPHHQLPCNSSSTNITTNAGSLSSIGGTLFGQSTSGINDAAEVSICKFKFTGGAKPCLQEKKMLSVDSGGNFRFYTDKTSGPGSKLAKNQQYPSSTSTSCSTSSPVKSHLPSASDMSHSSEPECHFALSSLPKSAKSMSMCMSVPGSNPAVHVINSSPSPTPPIPSTSKSRSPSRLSLPLIPIPCSNNSNPISSLSPTTEELQQLRLIDTQTQAANHPRSSSSVSPYHGGEFSYSSSNSCSSDNSNENPMGSGFQPTGEKSGRLRSSSSCGSGGVHGNKLKMKRKRRTRKSLMREKLEKTFKEKGFLIQTQQLESAEGATYCKFRQLRKFTRYLFRSWKDYLPDHVKEISDNNNGQPQQQQQSIEGVKNPSRGLGCSNQTDSRCSTSTGQGGDGNLQTMEMDSNDFQDEDGDEDGEDDEDLDEDDGDAMISDGNDESEEIENGRRLSSSSSSLHNKIQKKRVEEDEEEEMHAPVVFDSSRGLHSQQPQTTTAAAAASSSSSTKCFTKIDPDHEEDDGRHDEENTNEDEEELQVDA